MLLSPVADLTVCMDVCVSQVSLACSRSRDASNHQPPAHHISSPLTAQSVPSSPTVLVSSRSSLSVEGTAHSASHTPINSPPPAICSMPLSPRVDPSSETTPVHYQCLVVTLKGSEPRIDINHSQSAATTRGQQESSMPLPLSLIHISEPTRPY